VAALAPSVPGSHVLCLAAPETLVPYPTEELVRRYHPDVPHPTFAGRPVPIDLEPARALIGFTASYLWPIR
jgi:hypothetical protein